ncbi:hypothetical protein HanXRQr2_Chr11g0499151 [Helianthus annuus]|uniref:Uncharacterized protein n=1 Tax=Helianthus annuus TaxID=4232 RepID=A0A9K3N150_HELAN|nr:hypothetical protein HanXRQr2_Chr11g0499151 [Helianthus annuus]KAJ0955708.1 hypothetical protein HanPSC8_Chr01g0005981 [Helianthus annuus]
MTSSEHSSKPEEETAADDFAFMTQILSAPVKGLTKEEMIALKNSCGGLPCASGTWIVAVPGT